MPNMTGVEKELADYLNKHSLDNRAHTPDFILANHLLAYIENVRNLIFAKETWDNGQPTRFVVGDYVEKIKGYTFPGVVVSVFETTEENIRYVVEHRISKGMLHIFSGDQLTHNKVAAEIIKPKAESTPSDDAVRHGTQPHSNPENYTTSPELQEMYELINRSGLSPKAKLDVTLEVNKIYAEEELNNKEGSDSASAASTELVLDEEAFLGNNKKPDIVHKHYDFNTGPVLAGVDNTD